MGKKLEGAGLRGQVAGETALSTVGKEGKGLTYRGYAIEDLAEKATFEEVAYMLLYGKLPNQDEYDSYTSKLRNSSYGCVANWDFYVRKSRTRRRYY